MDAGIKLNHSPPGLASGDSVTDFICKTSKNRKPDLPLHNSKLDLTGFFITIYFSKNLLHYFWLDMHHVTS